LIAHRQIQAVFTSFVCLRLVRCCENFRSHDFLCSLLALKTALYQYCVERFGYTSQEDTVLYHSKDQLFTKSVFIVDIMRHKNTQCEQNTEFF